jgi:subtilisin family serine protease
MKLPRIAAAALIFLLVCMQAGRAFALQKERLSRFSPASGINNYMEVVSGLAAVRLTPGISSSAVSNALSAAGFSIDQKNSTGGWYWVSFDRPMSVSQALSSLKSFSFVEKAEPDRIYKVKRVPDDPYVSRQYALSNIQAFGAWEFETGASSRVTVAVIDTGIEATHPEFSLKFSSSVSQYCNPGPSKLTDADNSPCTTENPPTAACYHGTSVAGVAAAAGNNSAGIAGMTWGGKLVSMRVFRTSDCTSDCGSASCETDDKAMADALNFLAGKHNTPAYGKIVANLSLGCPVSVCGSCSLTIMQAAVNNAVSAGMLIFAAAGNGGDPYIDSPADCEGVKAVGATDGQDNLAYFSSTDSTMTYKGITAPGVDVYATTTGGGYASVSGTSFSSPMAAGLAALLWSAKPERSADEIWNAMRNSADDLGAPGPDRNFGWGRINALKAMRLAVTGTKQFAGTNKAVAYPNPFRPKTQRLVSFTIPETMLAPSVEVKVYTSEGELVKKLDALAWDGKNEAGASVASGVYIFRVKTDKDAAVGKFALLR